MVKDFLIFVDRLIEKFLRWGSLICLVSLLILVAGNVLFRFIPILSMGWADEIIEFFFAWMIFFMRCSFMAGTEPFSRRILFLTASLPKRVVVI